MEVILIKAGQLILSLSILIVLHELGHFLPAKWFGIADSYGKLEAGMDADLVIWDGDPLELTTSADQVFIQGKLVNMISRQTRLRDRYMNKGDMPAAYSK